MRTLAQAARGIPNRRGGRGVNVATVWRWTSRGLHGQRLETMLVGGVRYTSEEALERFFAAVTAAANGETPPIRTARSRERAVAAATRQLLDDGV